MKTVKYAWLMWVICVATYVLLAVIIPFQQTSIYWIAVCTTLIMFGITRCAYVFALRKGDDTESKLLGWPIFKVALVANCVQIIISFALMIISTIISVRLTLCIEIVLFALTLICLVVRSTGREVVVSEEAMFYQDIPNMIDSSEEAAQSGSPISIAKNNLSNSAAGIMYPYIDGTMWGFLDAEGNTLIQPQYSFADFGNAGVYIVEVGTHFGLIDGNGMTLLPVEYDSVEYIADNVYLAKRSSKSFIVHPIDGEVIDVSAYPDVFHLGDGLIQYFDKVRTSAGIQYYAGLLDYDGAVLCEPADASYVHYPERGLIGVSYSGDNAGAKIIDHAGKTYVDFVAGGWMMPTIEVPTMQISSGHTVVETVVYFESTIHRLKSGNGLRHCGAFEGYIDVAGNYYSINQKPENGTYVYIAFAQKDDANNIIIYSNGYQLPYEVFSFPTTKYGSYTNNVRTHNGFGVIASKQGVPFYVCTDITGREMTDAMNHAIFTFTHDNHYSHITLHPVNGDGIGLAEVQESDGNYLFMVAQLNPITHDETWYPITMQTRKGVVCAISPYQFGHAVIYDDSGKAGIVNAQGQIITDMIYDHIILYDHYAIGITGDVLYPASYFASDVVVIDDMPYSKQFSVSGYGDSIVDEEIIVRNGTTQVIEYTN